MSEGKQRFFRAAGIVLIAAALCAIGFASYNIISTEINDAASLSEAEREMQDIEAEIDRLMDEPGGPTADPQEAEQLLGGMNAIAHPTGAVAPESPGGTMPALTEPAQGGTGQSPAATAIAAASPSPGATPAAGGQKPKKKPNYFGILIFERLGNRKVAVVDDTDPAALSRGAMHHSRSSPAGAVGNCVIFGHRSTVFRGFGQLRNGDIILLKTPGKTYTYKIATMSVVEPDDPAMFKAYDKAVMTLVTCYPHNYLGAAPQRYMVVCVLQKTS